MRSISLATAKAVLGGWLFLVAGCPHMGPGPVSPSQQYLDQFAACMEASGISAAPSLGMQIWNILSQPGATQAQMLRQFESLGISAAGAAVQNAALCAVSAWASLHPVAGAVSPGQAAARVLMMRMAPRSTMRR